MPEKLGLHQKPIMRLVATLTATRFSPLQGSNNSKGASNLPDYKRPNTDLTQEICQGGEIQNGALEIVTQLFIY